jgi:hypothetical protein
MSAFSPAVLSRDTDSKCSGVGSVSGRSRNPMLPTPDLYPTPRALAGDGVADVTANAAIAATAAAITESNYRVVATSRHRRPRHRVRRRVNAILTGQRHRCRVRPRNVSMPTSPIRVSIPPTRSLPANPSSRLFRLLPTIQPSGAEPQRRSGQSGSIAVSTPRLRKVPNAGGSSTMAVQPVS